MSINATEARPQREIKIAALAYLLKGGLLEKLWRSRDYFGSNISSWLISTRANFEPYDISPVRLCFNKEEQEVSYRAFILKTIKSQIRFSILIGIFIVILYGVLDFDVYNGYKLKYALIIRFLIILPIAIFVFIIHAINRFDKYSYQVGSIGIFSIGVAFAAMLYRGESTALVYIFPAIIMCNAFAFFFIGSFFVRSFAVAACLNGVFISSVWTAALLPAMAVSVSVSTLTLFVFFSMASYQKELISRQLYVSELREKESRLRQAQADERYLAWLKSLAQFLRHEVRNPIAQINSSIEIVQLARGGDAEIRTFLTNAAHGARQVWNLVERASQATDAEAFVKQQNPQTLPLQEVLNELVCAHQQCNSGIRFDLKCASGVRLFADETQLKEAINNLISNAVSFADEDSVILVDVLQEDSRLHISVINEGPQIEQDSEILFGPFASTRSGPTSHHHGLGLYLVRLIAEAHGGKAEIANLGDGAGVKASIILPLQN